MISPISKIKQNLKQMQYEVQSYRSRGGGGSSHGSIDLPEITRGRHYLLVSYLNNLKSTPHYNMPVVSNKNYKKGNLSEDKRSMNLKICTFRQIGDNNVRINKKKTINQFETFTNNLSTERKNTCNIKKKISSIIMDATIIQNQSKKSLQNFSTIIQHKKNVLESKRLFEGKKNFNNQNNEDNCNDKNIEDKHQSEVIIMQKNKTKQIIRNNHQSLKNHQESIHTTTLSNQQITTLQIIESNQSALKQLRKIKYQKQNKNKDNNNTNNINTNKTNNNNNISQQYHNYEFIQIQKRRNIQKYKIKKQEKSFRYNKNKIINYTPWQYDKINNDDIILTNQFNNNW